MKVKAGARARALKRARYHAWVSRAEKARLDTTAEKRRSCECDLSSDEVDPLVVRRVMRRTALPWPPAATIKPA